MVWTYNSNDGRTPKRIVDWEEEENRKRGETRELLMDWVERKDGQGFSRKKNITKQDKNKHKCKIYRDLDTCSEWISHYAIAHSYKAEENLVSNFKLIRHNKASF